MLGMQVRQRVLLAKWCLVQIFSIPLVAVGCSFLFPMAHGAAPPEPIFATSQVRHHGCHFSMCKHGHPWDCDLTAAVPCLWRDQRCHACDLLRLVVVKLVPQDVLKCNVLIHCSDGWDRTAQVSSARSPRSPSQPWLNRYPTGVWLKHGVLLKSRHFFDQNYRILFSYATTCCILLRHMAYMIKILRMPLLSVPSRWQCFVWIHTTAPCAACCSWSRRTPRRCENVWWCLWILVGGLEHVLFFHILGILIPAD